LKKFFKSPISTFLSDCSWKHKNFLRLSAKALP